MKCGWTWVNFPVEVICATCLICLYWKETQINKLAKSPHHLFLGGPNALFRSVKTSQVQNKHAIQEYGPSNAYCIHCWWILEAVLPDSDKHCSWWLNGTGVAMFLIFGLVWHGFRVNQLILYYIFFVCSWGRSLFSSGRAILSASLLSAIILTFMLYISSC